MPRNHYGAMESSAQAAAVRFLYSSIYNMYYKNT